MLIRYDARVRLLVVTKGHPYDRAAFCDLFDAMKGISWTHIEQPAAAEYLGAGGGRSHDLILFYDVPGIQFRTPKPPDLVAPPEAFKQGFRALLAEGKPMLFLHHAIAGWPLWDEYAEAIGARFFYQPGTYKGRAHPDSGYLFPATYRALPVEPHPVTAGLEDGFELTDELYLFEMLLDDRAAACPLAKAVRVTLRPSVGYSDQVAGLQDQIHKVAIRMAGRGMQADDQPFLRRHDDGVFHDLAQKDPVLDRAGDTVRLVGGYRSGR